MSKNEKILKELKCERNSLISKMNNISDLKNKHTKEFLKMGSIMCQLIDTQYAIMSSYFEVLSARIIYLEEQHE